MFRRLSNNGLALGLAVFIGSLVSEGTELVTDLIDSDAQARRAFRRNLAAASSNWHWRWAKLECTSPGCAYYVKANWTEADVKYHFTGMRNQKSMGGGVVMVYATNHDGPALVSYCFMADGSPTKIEVSKGVGADMGWAERRAREFFDATPAND